MILAVDCGRAEQQLGEGKVEQLRDLLAGPVGTNLGQLINPQDGSSGMRE